MTSHSSNPVTPANEPTQDLKDASRGIRIQKAMAQAGVASRRGSEILIAEGRVRVNGQLLTELPAWVDPQRDRIECDGQAIRSPRKAVVSSGSYSRAAPTDRTYIMLNKPRRVISTCSDPQGRPNVLELVDVPTHVRLFPVGRLDAESTGLMLLTDDGELAHHLTHPRHNVPKQYEVSVRGRLEESDVQQMRDGIHLSNRDGDGSKKASVQGIRIMGYYHDRFRGDRTRLSITLTEGHNREIRRILAHIGLKTKWLKRVAIGPLRLRSLAPGQWRALKSFEVQQLYKAAGLK